MEGGIPPIASSVELLDKPYVSIWNLVRLHDYKIPARSTPRPHNSHSSRGLTGTVMLMQQQQHCTCTARLEQLRTHRNKQDSGQASRARGRPRVANANDEWNHRSAHHTRACAGRRPPAFLPGYPHAEHVRRQSFRVFRSSVPCCRRV
jgi:hypothetical protein